MSLCSEYEATRRKPENLKPLVRATQDAICQAVHLKQKDEVDQLLIKLAYLTDAHWYLEKVGMLSA